MRHTQLIIAKISRIVLYSIPFLVYLVLAFRRFWLSVSLIPNIEPYPDTLYYSTPAWNLVHGMGMTMQVYGLKMSQIVPPLYSLYLIPFFIFNDIRLFYVANLLLGLITIACTILCVHILLRPKRLLEVGVIISAICFVVTVPYFYILPTFLMAENITLTLFALSTLAFIYTQSRQSISKLSCFLMVILPISLMLVKFSNLPLTIVCLAAGAWVAYRRQKLTLYSIFAVVIGLVSCVVLGLYGGIGSFLIWNASNIAGGNKQYKAFSFDFFAPNAWYYLRALAGQTVSTLWMNMRLMPPILSLAVLIGLVIGLMRRKYRFITLFCLTQVVTLFIFMSIFVTPDARYFLVLLPLFAILIAVGLSTVHEKNKYLALVAILSIAACLIATNKLGWVENERGYMTLKKQIGLNFKYAETPWNYIAVQEMNTALVNSKKEKTYMATFFPPFFVRYYANDHYQYLPLTEKQEFFDKIPTLKHQLGIKSTVAQHMHDLITSGNDVYVSEAYVGNVSIWREEFEKLKKEFTFVLVREGCAGTCNIYKLNIKE